MNRQNLIRITAWVVLGIILAGCSPEEATSAKQRPTIPSRPNVVFILTDDQSKADLGAYGHTLLETPNMDKLAQESMVFDNAFVSTAMCVPSRTSLYTGLHPMRHGAHPNHSQVNNVTCVAGYLEDLGYKVGLIGKIHVRPLNTFGFHYIKDLLDLSWDVKLTKEEMVLAMQTLSAGGDPFVLFICISHPHIPWPGEWGKNPEHIALPPFLFDTPETRLALSRYYANVEVADNKVGEAIDAARELDLYDDMVVFFASDNGAEVVHGKYTLYDAGIKVPFMVRWPGQIQPGSRSDALVQFVDVVPTLIDIAGGEVVDSLDGRSILPVLLQDAVEHHNYVYATSTWDFFSDYPIKAIRTRQYKYLLNPEFDERYSCWITNATRWNYREYGYWLSWLVAANSSTWAEKLVNDYLLRPMEELYDLEEDPNELNNIADDPAFFEVKMDLRERLRNWMIDQGDVHYAEEFFDSLP